MSITPGEMTNLILKRLKIKMGWKIKLPSLTKNEARHYSVTKFQTQKWESKFLRACPLKWLKALTLTFLKSKLMKSSQQPGAFECSSSWIQGLIDKLKFLSATITTAVCFSENGTTFLITFVCTLVSVLLSAMSLIAIRVSPRKPTWPSIRWFINDANSWLAHAAIELCKTIKFIK